VVTPASPTIRRVTPPERRRPQFQEPPLDTLTRRAMTIEIYGEHPGAGVLAMALDRDNVFGKLRTCLRRRGDLPEWVSFGVTVGEDNALDFDRPSASGPRPNDCIQTALEHTRAPAGSAEKLHLMISYEPDKETTASVMIGKLEITVDAIAIDATKVATALRRSGAAKAMAACKPHGALFMTIGERRDQLTTSRRPMCIADDSRCKAAARAAKTCLDKAAKRLPLAVEGGAEVTLTFHREGASEL
jgi:hypothetical protein